MTSTTEGSIPTAELPPILRADSEGPPLARRSWVWTIGPAYAGVFIWEPFLDLLGTFLAGATPLGRLAAVALLAAIACYSLLYLVPALSGWTAGRRLSLVGASAFGTRGSEWITGVAVAFGAIGFHAVSVFMALRLTILGLISCGLVAPSALDPTGAGPLAIQGPVILLSALFWLFITVAANGLRLTGVIVALMQVYTPVVLLLLGATVILTSSGLSNSPDVLATALASARPLQPGPSAGLCLFQLIFGYFAFSGLTAVDWGMTAAHRRDVRIGGWVSVILAGSVCAVLSLLTVAGAAGRLGTRPIYEAGSRLADPLTFHGAIFHGIGGYTGGTILMLFGLASLAPAIYAVFTYSTRLGPHWPAIGRRGWAWLGAGLAFVLIATSVAGRLESIFSLMGATFAPAVGAITADWLRRRGSWRGIRPGVNPAGLIAWGVGAVIGLVPLAGTAFDLPVATGLQPAALFAYLAAVLAYLSLAALGFEGSAATPAREAPADRSSGSGDGEAHAPDPSFPPRPDSALHQAGRNLGAS